MSSSLATDTPTVVGLNSDVNDTDKLMVISSKVQLENDVISQQFMEHLEMRRLGLPSRFGKPKYSSSSSRKRKRKRPTNPGLLYEEVCHNNQMTVDEDHEDLTKELSTISLSNRDDITNLELERDMTTTVCDNLDDVMMSHQDDVPEEDVVQEVCSIRMSNDSSDYLDINSDNNQLTIISDDDNVMSNQQNIMEVCTNKKKKKKQNIKCKGKNPYFVQRYVLFSLWDNGIKLDDESWYSVTPEPIARHIAQKVEKALLLQSGANAESSEVARFVIVDGFCGAGGNTIQFALCPSVALVYAIDIDPKKIALARHNATIYECADKIEFIVGDFMELIKSGTHNRFGQSIDACFLSPPWGGRSYLKKELYSLRNMTPDGFQIVENCARYLTKNLCFLLPRNFDQNELEPMSKIIYKSCPDDQKGEIKVEIEENRLRTWVKTMTAYFGDLVQPNQNDD